MRYLPLTETDRAAMLNAIGVSSIDDLFDDVPESARLERLIDLPLHAGEMEVERDLAAMASRNTAAGSVPSFLGAGAYRHHIPATVDHLIQRSEFLTSYTPYQPEVSQGTLQYLFEFQTQVATITGMDVANASMYDGATSCAEAVLMACRVTKRHGAILSGGLHPHYSDVTRTMTRFGGFDVQVQPPDLNGDETLESSIAGTTACVVVQYPSCFGHISDLRPLAAACHQAGALLIVVVTEIVALGALTAPGDLGADIVVGEGQSLGNALNFGGPYLGLFAARNEHVRQMPGRLCGETTDVEGRRGYVLTLSTREQHIRREKATSNICTNSGLCALAFCIHLSLLGGEGFARLAKLNHGNAVLLAEQLSDIPAVEIVNDTFFNEFTVRLPQPAAAVVRALAAKKILAGVPVSRLFPGVASVDNLLLVATTECTVQGSRDALVAGLRGELQ
jgi:glycine dehydrogenase subunit 1